MGKEGELQVVHSIHPELEDSKYTVKPRHVWKKRGVSRKFEHNVLDIVSFRLESQFSTSGIRPNLLLTECKGLQPWGKAQTSFLSSSSLLLLDTSLWV